MAGSIGQEYPPGYDPNKLTKQHAKEIKRREGESFEDFAQRWAEGPEGRKSGNSAIPKIYGTWDDNAAIRVSKGGYKPKSGPWTNKLGYGQNQFMNDRIRDLYNLPDYSTMYGNAAAASLQNRGQFQQPALQGLLGLAQGKNSVAEAQNRLNRSNVVRAMQSAQAAGKYDPNRQRMLTQQGLQAATAMGQQGEITAMQERQDALRNLLAGASGVRGQDISMVGLAQQEAQNLRGFDQAIQGMAQKYMQMGLGVDAANKAALQDFEKLKMAREDQALNQLIALQTGQQVTGGGTDWGQLMGGGLSALGGLAMLMASDPKKKTDVKFITASPGRLKTSIRDQGFSSSEPEPWSPQREFGRTPTPSTNPNAPQTARLSQGALASLNPGGSIDMSGAEGVASSGRAPSQTVSALPNVQPTTEPTNPNPGRVDRSAPPPMVPAQNFTTEPVYEPGSLANTRGPQPITPGVGVPDLTTKPVPEPGALPRGPQPVTPGAGGVPDLTTEPVPEPGAPPRDPQPITPGAGGVPDLTTDPVPGYGNPMPSGGGGWGVSAGGGNPEPVPDRFTDLNRGYGMTPWDLPNRERLGWLNDAGQPYRMDVSPDSPAYVPPWLDDTVGVQQYNQGGEAINVVAGGGSDLSGLVDSGMLTQYDPGMPTGGGGYGSAPMPGGGSDWGVNSGADTPMPGGSSGYGTGASGFGGGVDNLPGAGLPDEWITGSDPSLKGSCNESKSGLQSWLDYQGLGLKSSGKMFEDLMNAIGMQSSIDELRAAAQTSPEWGTTQKMPGMEISAKRSAGPTSAAEEMYPGWQQGNEPNYSGFQVGSPWSGPEITGADEPGIVADKSPGPTAGAGERNRNMAGAAGLIGGGIGNMFKSFLPSRAEKAALSAENAKNRYRAAMAMNAANNPMIQSLMAGSGAGTRAAIAMSDPSKKIILGPGTVEGPEPKLTIGPGTVEGPEPEMVQDYLDKVKPVSFKYKDEDKYGEGRRTGVLSTDVAKSMLGDAMVIESPEGKMLNMDPRITGPLFMASDALLNQRINKLENTINSITDRKPSFSETTTPFEKFVRLSGTGDGLDFRVGKKKILEGVKGDKKKFAKVMEKIYNDYFVKMKAGTMPWTLQHSGMDLFDQNPTAASIVRSLEDAYDQKSLGQGKRILQQLNNNTPTADWIGLQADLAAGKRRLGY